MPSNPVTRESLTAEAQSLREQIERFSSRVEEIETLVKLGDKFNLWVEARPPEVRELKRVTETRITASARAAHQFTVRDRIVLGCESILGDGKRRFSRELVPELAKLGVAVGGRDPVGNLAAYLSKEKDRFDSNIKQGGWSLTRLTRGASPGDANTSPGLFSNGLSVLIDQHPKLHG